MREVVAEENGNVGVSANGDHSAAPSPFLGPEAASENAVVTKDSTRLPFYIAGSVLLIIAVVGSVYWIYARQFEYTDDAFIDGEIVQISPKISAYVVRVAVKENQFVKTGDLLVELNADDLRSRLEYAQSQLEAARAERIRARARTDLTRLTAYASQLEARSNVNTARNRVEESGMTAEARRSEIRQAESSVNTARANLAQAQARIPQAEANLRLYDSEYHRSRDLFNHGSISRQSLDHAENALSRARAELDTARSQARGAESLIEEASARVVTMQSNYKQSLAQIEASKSEAGESLGRMKNADSASKRVEVEISEVGVADAAVRQAEAVVQGAELELAHARIYAPKDGFVTRVNALEGQLVQPGGALMAISQTNLWIVGNFKETQLDRMRVGQRVEITVDALPGRTFLGRVESFQAGTGSAFSLLPPENAGGNFVKVVQRVPVKIVFEEKPANIDLLVPGMSARPRVRVL